MRALHDLVQAGKIRYLGASSMFLWQLVKLQTAAERNGWTKFSVMQNHYNALYREEEREMIPYCIENGIALMPYSPLASGILCRPLGQQDTTLRAATDPIMKMKYFKPGDAEVVQSVQEIAERRGVPAAQVALAWVLQKPGVVAPVLGATKPHHLEDAVKALQLKLTEEEMTTIEGKYLPHPIAGNS